MTDPALTFPVSMKAFSTIEGSEIFWNPIKYDGGTPGAHDAYTALREAPVVKRGRGKSLIVTTTRDGAATIENYCRTVGETFVYETEAETKADGRALLAVADRIRGLL